MGEKQKQKFRSGNRVEKYSGTKLKNRTIRSPKIPNRITLLIIIFLLSYHTNDLLDFLNDDTVFMDTTDANGAVFAKICIFLP